MTRREEDRKYRTIRNRKAVYLTEAVTPDDLDNVKNLYKVIDLSLPDNLYNSQTQQYEIERTIISQEPIKIQVNAYANIDTNNLLWMVTTATDRETNGLAVNQQGEITRANTLGNYIIRAYVLDRNGDVKYASNNLFVSVIGSKHDRKITNWQAEYNKAVTSEDITNFWNNFFSINFNERNIQEVKTEIRQSCADSGFDFNNNLILKWASRESQEVYITPELYDAFELAINRETITEKDINNTNKGIAYNTTITRNNYTEDEFTYIILSYKKLESLDNISSDNNPIDSAEMADGQLVILAYENTTGYIKNKTTTNFILRIDFIFGQNKEIRSAQEIRSLFTEFENDARQYRLNTKLSTNTFTRTNTRTNITNNSTGRNRTNYSDDEIKQAIIDPIRGVSNFSRDYEYLVNDAIENNNKTLLHKIFDTIKNEFNE